MSLTSNGKSVLQWFEHSNVNEICDRIIFDFCHKLPHTFKPFYLPGYVLEAKLCNVSLHTAIGSFSLYKHILHVPLVTCSNYPLIYMYTNTMCDKLPPLTRLRTQGFPTDEAFDILNFKVISLPGLLHYLHNSFMYVASSLGSSCGFNPSIPQFAVSKCSHARSHYQAH